MSSSTSVPRRELVLPDAKDEAYQKQRKETDLREPYWFPREVLERTKDATAYDVAESPMIAFINARSGGRMGPELLMSLYRALGNAQKCENCNRVYDVLTDRPDTVLGKIWENLKALEEAGDPRVTEIKRRMKVVACGGDGTVTWVLKVVKEMELDPPPAVAVVPLGTGNDLSRTYKWGRTFKPKWIKNASALYDHLKEMSDGIYKTLDCWRVDIRAPNPALFAEMPHVLRVGGEEGKHVTGYAWNYLSIGMDAQAAYGFHHLRENHPRLAFGRLVNQFWYSFYGLRSGWFCCCNAWNPPVGRCVSVELLTKSDEWKAIEIPNIVKAIVLVNLQSYAGGRNIWGKSGLSKKDKEKGLTEPKLNDGLFELVGFRTGWHTGFVMVGMAHCIRLGQGKAARLKAQKPEHTASADVEAIYMQIDGEPWKQKLPAQTEGVLNIEVAHHGVSSLLMNKRKMEEKDFEDQPPRAVQTAEASDNKASAS